MTIKKFKGGRPPSNGPRRWREGDRVKIIDSSYATYGHVGTMTGVGDKGSIFVLVNGYSEDRPYPKDSLRWISRPEEA